MVCPYDVRHLSDEAALYIGSAIMGAYALHQLAAPHQAYESYFQPAVPYSEPMHRLMGLGALSMAATPGAVARLPNSRAAKKLLLKLTGATWVAFALADLYWARTGICQGGVAHNSAAINLGLGAYFLWKGFQAPAEGSAKQA